MSVDQTNIIDAISLNNTSNIVELSIIDALDWENPIEHLLILQSKINAYFNFVESGQIYEEYSDAIDNKINIGLISKYDLPAQAEEFLDKARKAASQLNITISSTKL